MYANHQGFNFDTARTKSGEIHIEKLQIAVSQFAKEFILILDKSKN